MSKKILRIDDKMAKVARDRQQRKGTPVSVAIDRYQYDLIVGISRRCDDGPIVNKLILVKNGTFDVHSVADYFFGCPSADLPYLYPDTIPNFH